MLCHLRVNKTISVSKLHETVSYCQCHVWFYSCTIKSTLIITAFTLHMLQIGGYHVHARHFNTRFCTGAATTSWTYRTEPEVDHLPSFMTIRILTKGQYVIICITITRSMWMNNYTRGIIKINFRPQKRILRNHYACTVKSKHMTTGIISQALLLSYNTGYFYVTVYT